MRPWSVIYGSLSVPLLYFCLSDWLSPLLLYFQAVKF